MIALLALFVGAVLVSAGVGALALKAAGAAYRALRSTAPPPLPANVVAGLVLPEPDDPRWEESECAGNCHQGAIRMGAVLVCLDAFSVSVGGYRLARAGEGEAEDVRQAEAAYGRRVLASYLQRRVMQSILDEGPAPQVRMIP